MTINDYERKIYRFLVPLYYLLYSKTRKSKVEGVFMRGEPSSEKTQFCDITLLIFDVLKLNNAKNNVPNMETFEENGGKFSSKGIKIWNNTRSIKIWFENKYSS